MAFHAPHWAQRLRRKQWKVNEERMENNQPEWVSDPTSNLKVFLISQEYHCNPGDGQASSASATGLKWGPRTWFTGHLQQDQQSRQPQQTVEESPSS